MSTTANWIIFLRTNAEAWQNYLGWIAEQRRLVLERDPKSWDEEKERQGAKKALDNVVHLSTIDLKNEAQRVAYLEGK
jgi:hypothetical protein